jgi:hypothetical protein
MVTPTPRRTPLHGCGPGTLMLVWRWSNRDTTILTGNGRSRRHHGDTKSSTSRLVAVEAAKRALKLRVWRVLALGLRVGGGGLAGVDLSIRVWDGGGSLATKTRWLEGWSAGSDGPAEVVARGGRGREVALVPPAAGGSGRRYRRGHRATG